MNICHTDRGEIETYVLPIFSLWNFVECHLNTQVLRKLFFILALFSILSKNFLQPKFKRNKSFIAVFWMHFNLNFFQLFITWFIRCLYYYLQITSLTLLHDSTLIICQQNCSCVQYCIFLSLILKHVVVHSLLLSAIIHENILAYILILISRDEMLISRLMHPK